ncbi:MAG: ATP-binding protein [Desulfotomaculales bacterium]
MAHEAAYHCPLCQDRGIVASGEVARLCGCRRERVLFQLRRRAGLPPAMHEATFERFDLRYYSRARRDQDSGLTYYELASRTLAAAREFVRGYLRDPHVDGLYLTGPVGSGKTFLACCVANALLNEGRQVLFLTVPDWLDRIRATFDAQNQTTEQELTDAAREAPVLILDDLGVHNYTAWTINKLYSILNYRLNYLLPTIITTNISLEDLSEYLGDRTTSRLFAACRACRLLVDVDIRIRRRQEKELRARQEAPG